MKPRVTLQTVLVTVLITLAGCTRSGQTNKESESTISAIAHESLKSVVTIITSDATGRPLAQGSGFIVSPDGKVATNYHVIAGASSAVAKLSDGGMLPRACGLEIRFHPSHAASSTKVT